MGSLAAAVEALGAVVGPETSITAIVPKPTYCQQARGDMALHIGCAVHVAEPVPAKPVSLNTIMEEQEKAEAYAETFENTFAEIMAGMSYVYMRTTQAQVDSAFAHMQHNLNMVEASSEYSIPPWMLTPYATGLSGEQLGCLPETVRAVMSDPSLVGALCGPCQAWSNFVYSGQELEAAFCGACVSVLSRRPEFACPGRGDGLCGRPRHINSLAELSGPVCSTCDKADKH